VLVGSKNVLSAARTSPLFEVALVASGSDIGPQALEWARGLCPPDLRNDLRWRADQLGWTGPAVPAYPLPPVAQIPSHLAEIVCEVEKLQAVGPQVGEVDRLRGLVAGVREWLGALPAKATSCVARSDVLKFLASLDEQAESAGLAVAELIHTAAHRRFVFRALESAQNGVLITSHRLSSRAAGPNFRAAVASALRRGVHVTLLWGEHDEAAAEGVIEDLRAVASGAPGRLTTNAAPLGIHCKLLVADGRLVLVTSYELLHFAHSQRYERDELGVSVDSPRLANQLLLGLAAHIGPLDSALAAHLSELTVSAAK
jgi:hypothetical protein